MPENQVHETDFDPIESHWDIDWREEAISHNPLPWWVWGIWLAFLLWGVLYLIDSAAGW